jgi:radical SAM-linked protein
MLDFELTESSNISYIKECINGQLPPGVHVTSVEKIPSGKKKSRLKGSTFVVTLNGAELEEKYLKRFLESDHFPVVKITKKGEHRIDARQLVKSIRVFSPNKIELILKHIEGPKLKPDEIVEGIFHLKEISDYDIKTVKTKQVLV